MTTAYNVRNAVSRSGVAKRQFITDTGAGTTIKVYPSDLNVLQISSTGARTLQAAAQVPVGTQVLVVVNNASGVTVNNVAIGTGRSLLFMVTITPAATTTNQWSVIDDGTVPSAVTNLGTTTPITITPAQLLTRIMSQVPAGASAYTLPTAALLVQAMPGVAIGDTFTFIVHNNGGVGAITMNAGAGGVLAATAATIAANVTRQYLLTITGITAAAEAYIVYSLA